MEHWGKFRILWSKNKSLEIRDILFICENTSNKVPPIIFPYPLFRTLSFRPLKNYLPGLYREGRTKKRWVKERVLRTINNSHNLTAQQNDDVIKFIYTGLKYITNKTDWTVFIVIVTQTEKHWCHPSLIFFTAQRSREFMKLNSYWIGRHRTRSFRWPH